MSRGSGPKYPNSMAARGIGQTMKDATEELKYLVGKARSIRMPKYSGRGTRTKLDNAAKNQGF